ncbi:MAG: PilN domain-containing protein [Gammaproteobacteria bacterium]|nr:PilN domain-containing protein [Gammaproteobacteria bacterium]
MANSISRQPLLRNGIDAFNRALEWWLFELRAIAGSLFRFAHKPALEFGIDDNAVPRPDDGSTAVKAGRGDIRLKPGDNAFQYRKIKLPQNAQRNVERVVYYEFGKYFPLQADDALFSCTVIPPPKGAASIEIEIWAISRSIVDAYVTMIRHEYEIDIRKLILSDSKGRDLIVRNIERERRLAAGPEGRRMSRMLNLMLAALVAVLVIYPVVRMDAYLARQKDETGILEKRAQPVIELREKVMAMERRFHEVADGKSEKPLQAYLWSYLTRSMADRATLNRVALEGRSIQVQGKARSVEELLRRLETDPLVTEVKIVGAVKASADPLFEILNLSLTLKE